MTGEDKTAAKLQGYNCLVKFRDGEELLLIIPHIDGGDEEETSDWFKTAEDFINGDNTETTEYFPLHSIAVSRDSIKYILKI